MSAFFKLLIWAFIAFLVSFINRRWIFGLLVTGGVVESMIGFLQVLQHKSLGLLWLGESVLTYDNFELARAYLGEGGGLLLRAYGTFPHPNILAGFLILSLMSTYYFFLREPRAKYKKLVNLILTTAMIFIIWSGLLITFSRAGWLIAIITTLLFLYFACDFGFDRKNIYFLSIVIIFSVILLIIIFHWAVIPRILSLTPNNFTVQNRISDYRRAISLILERPWLGHGLTLRMGDRPIHNLYLLIATEVGLSGLALFLLFIGSLFWKGFVEWERTVVLIMLTSLLLFGLFDHFLWTLRPGLGMLWLVIGMLLRNKHARRSGFTLFN